MPENDDFLDGLDFSEIDFEGALELTLHEGEEPKQAQISLEDIGAYEVLNMGFFGQSEIFIRPWLLNTRADFEQLGLGEYTCMLKWPHNRVNDEDVRRQIAAFRSQLSRLRAMRPEAPAFVFVLLEYKIMPDKQHVFVRTARMTPSLYEEYLAASRASKPSRSALHNLKDLL